MWGKKKEEKNKIQTTSGSSSSFQTSTVTTGNNRTTTKVVSLTTNRVTSTIQTSQVTRQEIRSPLSPTKPQLKNTIWDMPLVTTRPALQSDAFPYRSSIAATSVETGYQSPFNRRLPAYNSLRETTVTNPTTRAVSIGGNYGQTTQTRASPSTLNSSTVSLPATFRNVPSVQRNDLNYVTNGSKRGKAVILNNIKFIEEKEERKGAEKDEQNLKDLLQRIGFEVKSYKNLKKQEMLDKVIKFRSDRTLAVADMSLLVIMSHGHNMKGSQPVRGGYTEVLGIDGKGLEIEDILNEFSTENCPSMKGKPKIFIFQCCRGDHYETVHADASPMRKPIKTHADMLIAHSTLPGFVSLRDPTKGSWYIQSICKVFKEYAKEKDIESMLKIVDQELSVKHPQHVQTSSYESRGFNKHCFLNPVRPLL